MARAGFVYLWRDKQRNMYYIGSHSGTVDDGYICSSIRMKKAYNKRSNDFKRRILFYSESIEKNELHKQEQYWLNMIKEYELGDKYYNLKTLAAGGVNKHKESTKIKMSMASKGIPKSEAHRIALSIAHKGQKAWNKGKTGIYSMETRNRISTSQLGRIPWNKGLTKETDDRVRQYGLTRRIGG